MSNDQGKAWMFLTCNPTSEGVGFQTDLRAKVSVLGFSKFITAQKVREVNTFFCSLEHGKEGIMAIYVEHFLDKALHYDYYIIPLRWEREKVVVGLREVWAPLFSDRIPSFESGCLKVEIDGKVYSNKPGAGCVPDMNLICQYIMGEVDAEQVKAAATAHVEEMSTIQRLTDERDSAYGRLNSEVTRLEVEVKEACKVLNSARLASYEKNESIAQLRQALRSAIQAAEIPFWNFLRRAQWRNTLAFARGTLESTGRLQTPENKKPSED